MGSHLFVDLWPRLALSRRGHDFVMVDGPGAGGVVYCLLLPF